MEAEWIILSLIFAILAYSFLRRKKLATIPGPNGLPWIGNVLQLQKNPHIVMYDWALRYGDVFKIKMFGRDIAVPCSHEAIYDVLVKKGDDFGGRAMNYRTAFYFLFLEDIVHTSINPVWKVLKRISMTSLKQASKTNYSPNTTVCSIF